MSDDSRPVVVFLHGAGQSQSAWQGVIDALDPMIRGFTVDLVPSAGAFTLERAARHVAVALDSRGLAAAHVCGLSLGAMAGLQFALDYPHRAASLIVSGGQVRPNPALMAIQRALIRILPARMVAADEVSKQTLLEILRGAGRADYRTRLSTVSVPTLVLCGSRDRVNLPAARVLARDIPEARLEIVPEAGHAWNVDAPAQFARLVSEFVHSAGARAS